MTNINRRLQKINSLLKEVLIEVIRKEVKDPKINTSFISITKVDITRDLHYAKVFISIVPFDNSIISPKIVLRNLQKASKFIASKASDKIEIRFFPTLSFVQDLEIDHRGRIEEILSEIHSKENNPSNLSPHQTLCL